MGICNSNNKPKNITVESESYHKKLESIKPNKISDKSIYEDINKFFILGNHIGNGSYGIVREAERIDTKEKYAIKSVWKYQFDDEIKIKFLKQEIDILSIIDHENIIKCHFIYEDNLSIHFVFDLIRGGDLLEHLMTAPDNHLPENQAQEYIIQILDAIQYLHSMNIVHRDIKPDNFLISFSNSGVRLKLIDFGFAVILEDNQSLKEVVGSQQYMAPEIINILLMNYGEYDFKVDIWAAGVVLYNMITGKQPFLSQGEELSKNIMLKDVVYGDIFKSESLIELLRQLLNKNPEERINANMAKLNLWVSCPENLQTVIKPFLPNTDTIKHINDFNLLSDLKHEIWTLSLTYLTLKDIEIIKEIVKNKLKENKNNNDTFNVRNVITCDVYIYSVLSVKEICPDLRIKMNDLIKKNYSVVQKHILNYLEFFDNLRKCKEILKKEKVWNIFKNFDEKGCGYLTYDQALLAYKDLLEKKFDLDKLKKIIISESKNKKDIFKFDEFHHIWKIFEY